jgi:hypothetical protein
VPRADVVRSGVSGANMTSSEFAVKAHSYKVCAKQRHALEKWVPVSAFSYRNGARRIAAIVFPSMAAWRPPSYRALAQVIVSYD